MNMHIKSHDPQSSDAHPSSDTVPHSPAPLLRRVMCVEDDPDIRMILEFSLGQLGQFDVLCCADGNSAMHAIHTFAPDLILLDVMMPGLSGPQTLAALRDNAHTRHIPVIFMTAKAMADEVAQLMQLGADGVIVKPFDPVALPQKLHTHWEKHRARTQL